MHGKRLLDKFIKSFSFFLIGSYLWYLAMACLWFQVAGLGNCRRLLFLFPWLCWFCFCVVVYVVVLGLGFLGWRYVVLETGGRYTPMRRMS
jgi:hypothetical protein